MCSSLGFGGNSPSVLPDISPTRGESRWGHGWRPLASRVLGSERGRSGWAWRRSCFVGPIARRLPPSVLPDISPSRGEISSGRPLTSICRRGWRCRYARPCPGTDPPHFPEAAREWRRCAQRISPLEGEMSGRTEGGEQRAQRIDRQSAERSARQRGDCNHRSTTRDVSAHRHQRRLRPLICLSVFPVSSLTSDAVRQH